MLLMLAVIGVFATMARNSYGFDFIGLACFGLSALLLVQFVWRAVGEYDTLNRSDIPELAELLLLSALTGVFGLKAFYIYINRIEMIFDTIILLQVIVYGTLGYTLYTSIKKENNSLARNITFLYVSVVLFLLVFPTWIGPTVAMGFGVLGVVVSIPVFIGIIRQQSFEVNNKSVTLFRFIADSRNKAGLMLLFFLSAALFTGLSMLNVIPSIENVDRPKAYIELINSAESGEEKTLKGRYQHEEYKAAMDKFLKRHVEGK